MSDLSAFLWVLLFVVPAAIGILCALAIAVLFVRFLIVVPRRLAQIEERLNRLLEQLALPEETSAE